MFLLFLYLKFSVFYLFIYFNWPYWAYVLESTVCVLLLRWLFVYNT